MESAGRLTMKQRFAWAVLVALWLGLCVPPVFAQATGTVKGVCRDSEGKPITEGTVEWMSLDTGRKYAIKLNKKGEYFSLGISPGKYKATLFAPDGKELFHYGGVQVGLDEVTQDFDLKKEAAAQAQGQGLTPEQSKERQEQQAKALKEQGTVKTLNEKLSASKTAADAGDYETAISTMKEATEIDSSRDLLYFKLADYYRLSATKQTDTAEKKNRYELAAANYQKAIDLKTAHPDPKDTDANAKLAAYYNNLAEAYAKSGKIDDAVATYTKAAGMDPTHAAQYNFNVGAVLTNGDKMVAPEGTSEAFNKYLELAPTGTYAQPAKDMLASIGASVETGFKKKAAAKK